MKKGDLVCSKDKSVVGVVSDISFTFNNVTIAVVWNEPPTAQGCKSFVVNKENIEALPKGTIIKSHKLKCEYERYDSTTGVIHGRGDYISAVDNVITDVIFNDDVETKNNSQYRTLDIEPWDIMQADFTREEFIGFLKGNIIKYCLRKKGSDLQDFEKIEHYARKLQEVLKHEIV